MLGGAPVPRNRYKPVVSRVITHLQEQTVVWSLVSYASESSATLSILIDMGLRRQIVRSALVIIWSFFAGSELSHRLGKDMNTGTVKWFNSQKGFGFIQSTAGGLFVHICAVERAGMGSLNEGQKLSYDIVTDRGNGKSSSDRLQAA